jgi:hypothetical protein
MAQERYAERKKPALGVVGGKFRGLREKMDLKGEWS